MKGMQKIRRGKNFSGVVLYALKPGIHHKGAPVVIGGNMLSEAAPELITEFDTSKQLRPDVQKPVWHNSLRLPASESLSNDQWIKIADDYMQRMGFSDTHLRCYVLHDDEAGQHIHIIASRIDLNVGKLYLGRNENLISTRIINELEITHALTVTKTAVSPGQSKRKRVSRNEKMLAERTGKPSPKEALQRLIDESLIDKPDLKTFLHRLEQKDVQWTANIATTGRMSGFSFSFQGIAFKASQLGKAYSWKNLQEKLSYQPERDNDYLLALKSNAFPEKQLPEVDAFMQLAMNPADILVTISPEPNGKQSASEPVEAVSIGEAIEALSRKILSIKAQKLYVRSGVSLPLGTEQQDRKYQQQNLMLNRKENSINYFPIEMMSKSHLSKDNRSDPKHFFYSIPTIDNVKLKSGNTRKKNKDMAIEDMITKINISINKKSRIEKYVRQAQKVKYARKSKRFLYFRWLLWMPFLKDIRFQLKKINKSIIHKRNSFNVISKIRIIDIIINNDKQRKMKP